jgi:mono/diheme cytochrome c family protein
MKQSLVCLFLLGACAVWAAESPDTQIDRGRQMFLSSPKGVACATCHSLEGKGTAVGPDLTRLAGVVGPRGLVMTIQMSMTAYVQEIGMKNGRHFPGIQKGKDGETLRIFDLSKTPPELLNEKAADVASMKENTKWKHPPTGAGYTPDELADIISYLKFAATGVAKNVTVADLK